MRMCMTMAASGVNAPFVAHSVSSEEDRRPSVRSFDRPTATDRPTDRPRVPELLQRCQPASQPSWSPPLLLSSLLSLLVCFAEGCQAIENVILPTQLDRRLHTTTYIQFMDYAACLPSSLDNKRQRRLSTETNAPRGTGR